jgi:PIN domain nuclease of toxin-antitoxin system
MALGTDRWRQMVDVNIKGVLNTAAAVTIVEPGGARPAFRSVELPPIHKDPFDRLLVAQAWVDPMILLTDDDALRGYGDFVEVV